MGNNLSDFVNQVLLHIKEEHQEKHYCMNHKNRKAEFALIDTREPLCHDCADKLVRDFKDNVNRFNKLSSQKQPSTHKNKKGVKKYG